MVLFLDLDCQNLALLDFGMSDLEKEPFDLGIENFALRNETSPSSFSTSEQVHSRGTEHIFLALADLAQTHFWYLYIGIKF